ncbi:MAG TPA: caspase family protein, partial [Sphaerochaeta sp.]|nr:caspase family protein [Sphaerochaeta sp.]
MRKRILVLAIVLLASITLWAGTGDRHALVIGNGNYLKTTPLANPPTDATDVAKLLEDVGFTVTLQTDASLSQMEGTIREFANEAKKASAGTTLFYYAGHGVQFEGTNYLLPVDADIHKDYELRSKAVSMELVSSALNETDSDFNLILLDACRDNPFASSRGGARGLMAMGGGNPESMVVFSTSPGSVAQDGDGSNSPFTTALKQHLLTPDQEVRQLVASVSKSVQTMTKGRQIPWVNTSFTGSFYFVTAEQQLANSKESTSRLELELQSLENEIASR